MRRGKLYSANGKLYLSQIPYGISTSCYYFDDNYGIIASVSADMMLKSYDASAGLIINANVNGYFYALVALNKNADQVNLRNSAILRIYQKTSNGTTTLVAQRDIDICRNELFNMQLTMSSNNVLKVYIDYELSATSDVSSNPEIYNEGYAGVISLSGDALFDNFAVFGNSKSEPKSSSVATAGEYFDDFEDETAGEDPDMWLEPSDNNGVNMQDNWAVSEESGNLVYSVTPENTVAAKAVFDDVSVDKQKTVLFSENFDDCQLQSTNQGRRILLENRGWRTSPTTFSNTFAGYTSSGKFTEPAGITPVYFTNTTAAYGDHTLECDVNIDADFDATGSKHAIYIESGATDTSGTGGVGVRLR
ncbi:MAG: hypothetical protein MJ091_05970, partial [Clostridia bacterium]|nr:hypothetical protein [Clostridia bacterium]